jgi:hypothetical protein
MPAPAGQPMARSVVGNGTYEEALVDPAVFEELMMTVLVGGLVLFMGFIVWDLAKKSKAGRYGTLVLFGALGLGVLGFIIKTLVIGSLEGF